MNKFIKKNQEAIIEAKLKSLSRYPTNIKNAINKVISREMSDNEYMKDKDIMFDSKINQIIYFCKNDSYKNKLIKFLEKYDYEHFPKEWENETIRLKTSIVENLVSNTPIKCKHCNRANVYAITKQVRSGDEGATTFYTCLTCNYTWKEE